MLFSGKERLVRLSSIEMEGEISPLRDLLASKISVTLPETGSQVTPKNLHGDSEAFQESKTFKGSLSLLLMSRRARVSTGRDKEGGKRVENRIEKIRKRRNGCLAIVEFCRESQRESREAELLITVTKKSNTIHPGNTCRKFSG